MNLGELIKAGVVISIATLLLIPTSASALAVGDDDVELIIRGGYGVHFIVKKEFGIEVLANFTVYGRGIIDDRRFHNSSGNMSCSWLSERIEVWYTIHPMFLPITATLEANGKKVTRRGINTIYIVIFLTWEIEDVR